MVDKEKKPQQTKSEDSVSLIFTDMVTINICVSLLVWNLFCLDKCNIYKLPLKLAANLTSLTSNIFFSESDNVENKQQRLCFPS